uniref:Uncharacterized protein n=1 Tax=Schistosoma mansoni TaxID=6183 RepID=A0A146MG69_SCHMA
MYTQRTSNVILFHHAGGVDVGEVDSKVRTVLSLASVKMS